MWRDKVKLKHPFLNHPFLICGIDRWYVRTIDSAMHALHLTLAMIPRLTAIVSHLTTADSSISQLTRIDRWRGPSRGGQHCLHLGSCRRAVASNVISRVIALARRMSKI